MEERLDRILRKYRLVAGKIQPSQAEGGGRRPQPASRPPLQLDPVSEMRSFEQSLNYHEVQFDHILYPIKRIDITDRMGATCPYCTTGKLVGWIRNLDLDDHDDPRKLQVDEVICLNPMADEHAKDGYPFRWTSDEWRRLGVHVQAIDDRRFTTVHREADTG